jgi:3-hydroxyisobutyrate dehydrogenase/2-hydroxy-3-oxopropionate reductase
MTTVAVVGLGAMGAPIAGRLLDAGHEVVVWNRSPEKAKKLVDRGAPLAENPRDAAQRAEAVIIMVADPRALRDVTEGPDGIAAGVDDPTTVIQMSTVGPDAVMRLTSSLPEGTPLLDSPVLGSIGEAETGSLKVFVSGEASLVERWTPLLSELGEPIHVGPLGAGSAAKLVANSTLFGVLGVLGEALALAEALGLRREVAYEVLSGTPVGAQVERRRPAIDSGDYPPRFTLSLAVKDADLVLAAAEAKGLDLRLAKAARAWLADAEKAGWGERDYAAVLARIIETASA